MLLFMLDILLSTLNTYSPFIISLYYASPHISSVFILFILYAYSQHNPYNTLSLSTTFIHKPLSVSISPSLTHTPTVLILLFISISYSFTLISLSFLSIFSHSHPYYSTVFISLLYMLLSTTYT